VLLWLLSVTSSAAAHAPRQARGHFRAQTSSETFSVNKLRRLTPAIGTTSLVRVHKVRLALAVRRSHLQHAARTTQNADDDDAIQNDAPAAHFDVNPCLALRPIGVFIDDLEQQPFTLTTSPRSPRGPPQAV